MTYSYAQDANNTADAGSEDFGFERAVDNGIGVLRMRVGGAWQALTDPRSVDVTEFRVDAVRAEISLGDMCRGSPLSSSGTPPSACCLPHLSNPAQCKPDYFEWTVSGYTPTAGYGPPTGKLVKANCPQLIVRRFDIVVRGRGLPPNDNIRREIRESVRVRNDEITQVVCPP